MTIKKKNQKTVMKRRKRAQETDEGIKSERKKRKTAKETERRRCRQGTKKR